MNSQAAGDIRRSCDITVIMIIIIIALITKYMNQISLHSMNLIAVFFQGRIPLEIPLESFFTWQMHIFGALKALTFGPQPFSSSVAAVCLRHSNLGITVPPYALAPNGVSPLIKSVNPQIWFALMVANMKVRWNAYKSVERDHIVWYVDLRHDNVYHPTKCNAYKWKCLNRNKAWSKKNDTDFKLFMISSCLPQLYNIFPKNLQCWEAVRGLIYFWQIDLNFRMGKWHQSGSKNTIIGPLCHHW